MISSAVEDRNSKAAEYLQLLRTLAVELEKAMQAIAHNRLTDLEESVGMQQMMSARLLQLADEISPASKANHSAATPEVSDDTMRQVLVAGDTLQKLNRRYAVLLQHSSRSVALMASLFNSHKGQFKEASGPRLKQQTWSCQM